MGQELFPLDNLKVAAPCTADWRGMYGNERVRFCGQCNLNVYNLSAMTREEAEELILRREGRLCVRFYRRKDGTVITNNCPVGLRALKAKYNSTKATILKAGMTFLAYLGVLWWVEGPPIFSATQGYVDHVTVGALEPLPSPPTPLVSRTEQYIRHHAIFRSTPFAYSKGSTPGKADAIVKVVILPSGEVETATLISGSESIRNLTEGAVRQWKFEPMTDAGAPVRVVSTLTFHFGNLPPQD
jgi:hypothetical protein